MLKWMCSAGGLGCCIGVNVLQSAVCGVTRMFHCWFYAVGFVWLQSIVNDLMDALDHRKYEAIQLTFKQVGHMP